MAKINITIGGSLNDSLSVGDIAYYVTLASSVGGFQSSSGIVTALGTIDNVHKQAVTGFTLNGSSVNVPANSITVDVGSTVIGSSTLTNKMLLFAKDKKVNTSGLTGYYAEVKMTNTSLIESELYAVSSDIVQSSK